MKGTFELESPDKLQATITLTASVAEWRELRGKLNRGWPTSNLRDVIDDLIYQAGCSFYSDGEKT